MEKIELNDEEEYKLYIKKHIDGICRVSLYNQLSDGLIKFAAVDFDNHDGNDENKKLTNDISIKLVEYLAKENIYCFREISKSGFGNYHCWIFFDKEESAKNVRYSLSTVLSNLQANNLRYEIFPKQECISNEGYGSCIALPFFGGDVQEAKTIFIDNESQAIIPKIKETSNIDFSKIIDYKNNLLSISDTSIKIGDLNYNVNPINITKGNRNIIFTSLAGKFSRVGVERENIAEYLIYLNNKTTEPLSESEIVTIVNSVYKYNNYEKSNPIILTTAKDILTNSKIYNVEFLVEGLLLKNALSVIGGEEGSGKSILALNLAFDVAIGSNQFLNYNVNTQGKVLLLNYELDETLIKTRLEKMTSKLSNEEMVYLTNIIILNPGNIKLIDNIDWLRDIIIKEHFELVIIDCLYLAHTKKEQEADSMKSIYIALKDIACINNTTIVILHHTSKHSNDKQLKSDLLRGSQTLQAIASNIIMLKSKGESKFLKITKERHKGKIKVLSELFFEIDEKLWCKVIEKEIGQQEKIVNQEINWSDIMEIGVEYETKTILNKINIKKTDKTKKKLITKAESDGKLIKIKHNRWVLNHGTIDLEMEKEAIPIK